jgi:hypothetical protein
LTGSCAVRCRSRRAVCSTTRVKSATVFSLITDSRGLAVPRKIFGTLRLVSNVTRQDAMPHTKRGKAAIPGTDVTHFFDLSPKVGQRGSNYRGVSMRGFSNGSPGRIRTNDHSINSHGLLVWKTAIGAKRPLIGISCSGKAKLYSYLNNIGVRSFIPNGAPFPSRCSRERWSGCPLHRLRRRIRHQRS